MALAKFFSRTYSAIGSHLGITRADLEQVICGCTVGIHLGESCLADGNEKWTAELLTNLLARLYPSLAITGHHEAIAAVSKIAQSINPEIEIINDSSAATAVACVGTNPLDERSFLATNSGWVVRVCSQAKYKANRFANPYSAGAAAALAAWRVFQTVFRSKSSSHSDIADISFSLLDYSKNTGEAESLSATELGEVAVAGLGAVGNPALWAWARHEGLTGTLHLIDPEDIELSNLQRYCLPMFEDVGAGKTQLAARELSNTNLCYKMWPCTLEDFAENYDGIQNLPAICVSVDNIDGRRTAQALLPRLVVNGWTSENGLGASWHRFSGDSACLACLYHPRKASQSQTEMAAEALGLPHNDMVMFWVTGKPLNGDMIRKIEAYLKLAEGELVEWEGKRVQDVYTGVICGQVGLDLEGIGHVATVPLTHQSVLAGILMAAELVKRCVPELDSRSQAHQLVIWDDVMRNPPQYWTATRKKVAGCFCSDETYLKIYREKWED